MKRLRNLSALLVACLAMNACKTLSVCQVDFPVPPPPQFSMIPGLINLFTETGTVRLLVVHGMGHPAVGYSATLIHGLAEPLSLGNGTLVAQQPILDSTGKFLYGTLTITSYPRKATAASKERLLVYEVNWSPTTQPLRTKVLGEDDQPERTKDRVSVNRELKTSLMNERLSDPVLYLGSYQKSMQEPLRVSLRRLAKDIEDSNAKDPIAFVTFSLGSRMLFDTILSMAQEQGIVRIVQSTNHITMLANQLPLLSLGFVPPVETTSNPRALQAEPIERTETDGLKGFLGLRRAARSNALPGGESSPPPPPSLFVVAVSDPNDLLSYPITPSFARRYASEDVLFANLTVSIATSAYLGVAANPLAAHTGHDRNPTVLSFLARGEASLPKACLPKTSRP